MTPEEREEITQLVKGAQEQVLAAVAQANAVVVARLAWHTRQHESLRADLRAFVRDFRPDPAAGAAGARLHSMIDATLRTLLLRLSEIPDLENPADDA
ncbi:MAG: hypothetical protein JNM90_12100 [Burkholderiales bacterium]|nr:hypothetical protein [Burkholderiales bacterium]